jgi:hypothetical protein
MVLSLEPYVNSLFEADCLNVIENFQVARAYHQKVKPIDFVKIARERIAAEPPPDFLFNG